ncbi:MAG: hypothetical protein AB1671_06610 [Thermodesulfobacteriota bacterium]|jgi:hypothetical protein
MADKAAERIKFHTEVLKVIVLLAVAVGGGSFGLVLNPGSPLRLGLAAIGLVATVGLALTGWRQYYYVQRLIEDIQEDL